MNGSADDDRPTVLTTFTVLADIAGAVAGEHLRVESIIDVGVEVHGYDPTPADIRRANRADLIIDHGMGLEAWFAQFMNDVDAPRIVISDGIEPISIDADARELIPNPHTWMSPRNVILYVDAMVAAFSDLSPEHAADFQANGEAYKSELEALYQELVTGLASVPEAQRVLVSCEGAFSYLARDAGLEEIYIWPVNAERQATPQQVAAAIDAVQERSIPAVFCESTVDDGPMYQVVSATDANHGGILYVDSLSEAAGPVPSYLDLIRHDIEVIVAGLQGS